MSEERKTDPAKPMTDRQVLESIQESVAFLAAEVREMNATVGLVIGDAQSFNRRMSAVETRVAELEERLPRVPPPEENHV